MSSLSSSRPRVQLLGRVYTAHWALSTEQISESGLSGLRKRMRTSRSGALTSRGSMSAHLPTLARCPSDRRSRFWDAAA